MFRKLMATTAIAIFMAGPAAAANMTGTQDQSKSDTSATMDTNQGATAKSNTRSSGNMFVSAKPDDMLASNLVGKPVYNGKSKDAKSIGTISAILMSPKGNADAIIVGVGGILGMGEKQVALNPANIDWTQEDGDIRVMTTLTKDDLKSAPAFDRSSLMSANTSGRNEMDQNKQSVMTKEDKSSSSAMTTDRKNPSDKTKTAQNDNKSLGTGKMDKSITTSALPDGLNPVDRSTLSAEQLLGANVYGARNQEIGEIGDVLITQHNTVKAYVVDVGGFLGIGEKPVALDASKLKVLTDNNGNFSVKTQFTKDQLNSQTAYSAEAYRNNPDSVILR